MSLMGRWNQPWINKGGPRLRPGRESPTNAAFPQKKRRAVILRLKYGFIVAFHKSLAARMKRLSQGVAVLRGEPGTGKTTYIRALMWQLRRTHRFYTIPLQEFTRMTASDLTSFWLGEKKEHEKQTIVMVILGEKTRRQLIEFKGTSENLAHWPEATAKPHSAKPKIDIQANGLPVVRCGTNQNPLQSPRRQNPSGTFRPPNPLA